MTSYIAEPDWNEKTWEQLRTFLRRMGREARQGEIGLIIDGKYLGITEYAPVS